MNFQLDILSGADNKLISSCYEPTIEQSIGWCATCVAEAKKGEPGYCGPDQNKNNLEEGNSEIPYIYPNSTNWGFCHQNCVEKRDENELQVSSF